jgi:hypothetical protein
MNSAIRVMTVAFAFLMSSLTLFSQTTTWTNAAGGSFTIGANWSSGIPTAANDAVIDLAGTYAVTLNTAATVNTFTLNNATTTFNQTAGTYTISNGFTYTTGVYNLSGGALTLGNGMTMAGGTMTVSGGATINLTGTMQLNGGVVNLNNGTISGGTISGGGN